MMNDTNRILDVRGLSVHFPTPEGSVKALDRVDLDLRHGEVLGLMGQSGSGKTLLATALMGMVAPPGRLAAAAVLLNGRPLPVNSPVKMRRVRGRDIFMIFQSPASALNPTVKIGDQISEISVCLRGLGWKAARSRSHEFLERVHLSRKVTDAYPFELSGGMQQRVLIAMALAMRPRILIADEPTTGLDVVTQARILDLFGRLRSEMADAVLFISHDLRVLLKLARRIAVMHGGRIVETLPAESLTEQAAAAHTRAVLSAFRELDGFGTARPC